MREAPFISDWVKGFIVVALGTPAVVWGIYNLASSIAGRVSLGASGLISGILWVVFGCALASLGWGTSAQKPWAIARPTFRSIVAIASAVYGANMIAQGFGVFMGFVPGDIDLGWISGFVSVIVGMLFALFGLLAWGKWAQKH